MAALLEKLRETDPERWEIEQRGMDRQHPPEWWETEYLAALDRLPAMRKLTVNPVSASCDRRFTAVHHSGKRKLSDILYIAVHDEEAYTAISGASWFENEDSRGSAQLCVDAGACYRTLADTLIPWAAPGVNLTGWHIEFAGFAAWTRAEWLAHHGTLYRGAYKCAYHADKLGIPNKWLTDKQLAGGKTKGYITHRQASRVFGGDHHDPGTGFPHDVFMRDVRKFAATIGV